MCFTPVISISTAIFHFVIATWILLYFKKSSLNKTIVVVIYFLGLYQFTEFMLCTSSNPFLWAKIGFITYTFIPAFVLEFCLIHTKKAYDRIVIYAIPIIFSLIVLFKENVFSEATCGEYFVIVRHIFFGPENVIPTLMYGAYYLGFFIIGSYFLYRHFKRVRSKIKKEVDVDVVIGIFICLIPALILLFVFPVLYIRFASIYCQFGILFTIFVLLALHVDSKRRKTKLS